MGDQDYSSDAGLKRPPPPDDSYGYGGGQGGGQGGGNYEQGGNYQDNSSYNYDPSGQADSGYTYDPNASNAGSGGAAQYDPNSGGQYNQTGNSGGSGYEQSGGESQQGGGGYQQRGGGYNNQGNNNYRGRGGGRGRGRGGNNYNKQNFYNQGGNNYNNQNQGGGGYNQQTYYTQGNDYNYDAEGGDYGYMSKKRRIIDDVYRFLVPTRTVRVIIGKGGETIKSIKSIVPESKISIYAQGTNNSEIPHNASDRVMSVQCPLESLSKILMELVPKMQLFEGGKLDIRLLVPQHSCSAVIGQKGATIKQIKEETNSSFIGVHNDPLPNSEEHVVKVINTDLQNCVDAVVRVCASITETKGKQHVTFYDPQIWPKGSCGDTGSWLETASDYGGGRGRGRGRGRGFYGNRGGGGGYGGGNSGYYNNQQYGGGYDNQQGENQSYNYDPNTETGGENTKSEGGQDNYVSYPSY